MKSEIETAWNDQGYKVPYCTSCNSPLTSGLIANCIIFYDCSCGFSDKLKLEAVNELPNNLDQTAE